MKLLTGTGFNLKEIEEALHTFRSHFKEINPTLIMSREDFTPAYSLSVNGSLLFCQSFMEKGY